MLKFSREADDGGMGKTKQNNVVYVEFIRERVLLLDFFWEVGAEVHRLKVRGESFIYHRVSSTGA